MLHWHLQTCLKSIGKKLTIFETETCKLRDSLSDWGHSCHRELKEGNRTFHLNSTKAKVLRQFNFADCPRALEMSWDDISIVEVSQRLKEEKKLSPFIIWQKLALSLSCDKILRKLSLVIKKYNCIL